MFAIDGTGLLALLGLLVQCGLAWLFAILFAALRRAAGSAPYFRLWTWSFLALALALTAVGLRYGLALGAGTPGAGDEGSLQVIASYMVYASGRCLFASLLLLGALRSQGVLARAWLLLPVLASALGVGVTLLTPDIHHLLLLQASVLVPACWLTAARLLAWNRQQPNVGCRITATGLQLMALLWLWLGSSMLLQLAAPGALPDHWHAALTYHSYADLALLVVVGAGMIVIPLQAAQNATRLAQQERDRLQARLLRDEKLLALGTLVSGVAHELNNPLTSILGFTEEMVRETGGSAAARIVREQAERCRGIVRSLSATAGECAHPREHLDLPELVDRVTRGFQQQAQAAGLRLEVQHDGGTTPVLADRIGLEQVLANLLANAIYASPRGGLVRIRTAGRAGTLELAVGDGGPGIPRPLRSRVFEPFFTTKPPGEGSGLGLAVAHGIVRAHSGTIEIDDGPGGRGTLVRILLPTGQAPRPRTVDTPPPEPSRALHVLVVDDEPMVRQVLMRQLTARGHRATEAASAEAALSLLRGREPRAFDAVLCDLRMPGLDGAGLHGILQSELPELAQRFVFTTGDPGAEAATAIQRAGIPVAGKPFDFRKLMGLVERAGTPG